MRSWRPRVEPFIPGRSWLWSVQEARPTGIEKVAHFLNTRREDEKQWEETKGQSDRLADGVNRPGQQMHPSRHPAQAGCQYSPLEHITLNSVSGSAADARS